jgi:hypothetical protein
VANREGKKGGRGGGGGGEREREREELDHDVINQTIIDMSLLIKAKKTLLSIELELSSITIQK